MFISYPTQRGNSKMFCYGLFWFFNPLQLRSIFTRSSLFRSAFIQKGQNIAMYYLRSKMVIPFLEFELFWESLFTFLLIQIALWHKLDSSCKKDFTKIMQNDWKVNKLCWLFTQNQCRNNISDKEIDTLLFFSQGFWLKSANFTRKEWS